MKLLANFPELERVRRTMGASLSSWESGLKPVEREPIETEIRDLDRVQPIGPNGPLAYNGRQIILYIKDTGLSKQTLLNHPEKSKRFHIAECRTLRNMRRGGRFDRYVVTERTDGFFKVESTDPNTREVEKLEEVELYVCKNCVYTLGLDDDWPEFSISSFFRDHETFFHDLPPNTDTTAPPGGRPRNWVRISRTYREKEGWTCEKCLVNLSSHRKLLHCHHRNGVTSDNGLENLRALCAECHAREPMHDRVRLTEEDRGLLHRLRVEQGVAGAV